MTKDKPDGRSKDARRERQLAEDWQSIARSPEGRRVIADLFKSAWVFDPIEVNDPIAMARCVGTRNFAIRVATLLNMTPEIFDTAMRQNGEGLAEMVGDKEYRELMGRYLAPTPVMNS